jgi:hypothetical protein
LSALIAASPTSAENAFPSYPDPSVAGVIATARQEMAASATR